MKFLSQQLRELVEKSATSPYAIGKAAGISKSAMSRFMNGGSMAMDKLDQLAAVLGVEITSQVSLVPRPLEKGRPSTKETARIKMNSKKAMQLAMHYAEDAFQNHFSSRRGVWHLELEDCLLVYNNNPFGEPTIRPREMERIKVDLKAIGINTLARGEGGDAMSQCDDKYTSSLLLDCGIDRMQEVVSVVQDAANWAIDEIEKHTQHLRGSSK